MSGEMRIGIAGTGKIAAEFVKAAKLLPGVEAAAVYSRKEETGRNFAEGLGIERVYTDFDQMLTEGQVNFVYIALPNSLHYAYALRALRAGRHVICEKPFTSTLWEAQELIACARERERYLFEAVTTIHSPNFLLLKEKLPLLGKISLVQCTYSQYSSRYQALLNGQEPNIFNPVFSGGALMDLNVYNFHLTVGLFGRPQETVYYPRLYQNGVDTSGLAVLRYPDMLCLCLAAKDVNGVSSVQIQGENGYVYIPEGSNNKKAFRLILTDGQEEAFDQDRSENRLYHELAVFADIYSRGDRRACQALQDHTLRVMEVLDQAQTSAGLHYPAARLS